MKRVWHLDWSIDASEWVPSGWQAVHRGATCCQLRCFWLIICRPILPTGFRLASTLLTLNDLERRALSLRQPSLCSLFTSQFHQIKHSDVKLSNGHFTMAVVTKCVETTDHRHTSQRVNGDVTLCKPEANRCSLNTRSPGVNCRLRKRHANAIRELE